MNDGRPELPTPDGPAASSRAAVPPAAGTDAGTTARLTARMSARMTAFTVATQAATGAVALWAVAAPSLLAHNVPPSATFWNQALALTGWSAWVLLTAGPGLAAAARAALPVLMALALLAAAVLAGGAGGTLPRSLAAGSLGALAAAALLLLAGAQRGVQGAAASSVSAPPATRPTPPFEILAWALLAAGVLNAGVAALQVFAPALADGGWLARPGEGGRAIGNLRQPNHLASLLCWSLVALAALHALRRLPHALAAGLLALLVGAVVLTASRTGLLSLLLLALWGAVDARLPRRTRWLLGAAPLAGALAWGAMSLWAHLTGGAFGGARRLAAGGDVSSSRFAIWADALTLLREQPWTGVGWGRFNAAWTLSPSPGRPLAFFDHVHNLPLHLAVELGLPLAALGLALLGWGLWRAATRRGTALPAQTDTARRAAAVIVALVGVHSLLEYPLWYAHFLLPAAWCWGFALGAGTGCGSAGRRPDAGPGSAAALRVGALLVLLGSGWALADYARVGAVFRPPEGAAPLAQRVAAGQQRLFFAHHADYAAATTGSGLPAGPAGDAVFRRAAHHLLDTRLMTAWARHLHAQGDTEGARHLVQRLREFRRQETLRWLAECDAAATPSTTDDTRPWHCSPPQAARPWRALLAP